MAENYAHLVKEGICPNCKNKLAHKEGCVECEFCGWGLCEES
jgi:hypothetical protein